MLAVALFVTLPVGTLLGEDVGAPLANDLAAAWIPGLVLTLIGAGVLALAALRFLPSAWLARAGSVIDRRWWLCCCALVLLSVATNVYAVQKVFGGFPLHIDELTQAIQARIFATGRLWLPTPPDPEFVSALLMADLDGRTFAQFPPGWPALLALGVMAGVPWLIGPLAGAVAALAFLALMRGLDQSRPFALAAAALFVVSPWLVFNAASQMNHTATLASLLLASAALLQAVRSTKRSWIWAGLAGLCYGAAATVRPLEALAFGLPAGAWLFIRTLRTRRAAELAFFALGLALPVGLLLVYNSATTGSAFVFGYQTLWGDTHGLGFHDAPWGPAHTPARGLALLNKYFLRMQQVLFEAPVPVLLAPLAALALVRTLSAGERYLLAGAVLLSLGYLTYWHDGEYLGPRFLLPLSVLAIYWTARLPGVIHAVRGSSLARSWCVCWILLFVVTGFAGVARAARTYAASYPERRIDANALTAGVGAGVILVPSPWGAQLTPRLWALGIARRDAQQLYEQADPCTLERALAEVERRGLDKEEARSVLNAEISKPRELAPAFDASVQSTPAASAAVCRSRASAERAGTWSLLPFLAARSSQHVFVRDLHERNALLFRRFSGPFYVVRPDPELGPRRPHLVPLNVDSAQWEWTVTSGGASSR